MGMLFGVGDEAAHSDIGTLTTHTLHGEVNWGTNGVGFLGINTENGSQAYVLERAGGVLSLYDGSNVTTGSAINTGQFYGITIVRAVGTWAVYLDGVLDISSTSNPTGINAHSLGNSLADSEASITGVMDGFKAWNIALNATQVLAEDGVEAAVLQTGLVTEANMNDGARTTAQTGTNLVETGTVLDGGEATYAAGGSDPTIVDIDSDEIVSQGQTSVIVGGTNFEAAQAGGLIRLSPSDNIADANIVTLTVTSWADTSIQATFNFDEGNTGISEGGTAYIFVTNDTGDSNAVGFVITREDITAPTLTSPGFSSVLTTTATGSITTNEATGTLYAIASTSVTPPSVAQIQAGNDSSGSAAAWSGNSVISSTGIKNFNATGLITSTGYYFYFQHIDASSNDSIVSSTTQFTTNGAVTFVSDVLVNNTDTPLSNAAVSWTWYPLGTIGTLGAITPIEGSDTTDAGGVLTITGMVGGDGLLLATDASGGVCYEPGTAV